MVPDIHMLVEVLSREVDVLILHNKPLGAPTLANNPCDLGHIGVIVQQDLHFIGAGWVVLKANEVVDGGSIVLNLLPSNKRLVTGGTLRCVHEDLVNHRHSCSLGVLAE